MNNLDKQYQDLLKDILDNGTTKSDRTGTGTLSVFGRQIRHKMSDGFPLLTTKKVAFKAVITELLWFLRGDTNIKYLLDNNCNIWNGDAYKYYIQEFRRLCPKCPELSQDEFIEKLKIDSEFCGVWGQLGPIYGAQWRSWEGLNSNTDQIQNLINDLKTNPDSRRLMVNAWNVGELDQMVLPPCHYGFQVYTRELRLTERIDIAIKKRLTTKNAHLSEEDYWKWCDNKNIPTRAVSLMWNQRSVDTFLGLPFNIASYGLLLKLIAKEVNMIPDELIGNLGDTHLYLNHVDQAKEQLSREPLALCTLKILDAQVDDIAHYELNDIEIYYYKYHPAIKAPLSN